MEKYNVVGLSGIPVNRVYFDNLFRALEFILRQEKEDKRLGIFEPGTYRVEIVKEEGE